MNNLKNNKKIIIILLVIIIGIIIYFIYNNFYFEDTGTDMVNDILIKEDNIVEENSLTESKESDKVIVHITGEINNPGIIELESGDRIFNAIEKAGGTTKNADTSKINLAQVVEDGMKINVPNINDKEIVTEETVSTVSNSNNIQQKKQNIVNINSASQTELETLPGIGPSIASKIVNYRKEKGKFSKIEDIMNVNGIGEAKFEKIKKYIIVK